MFATYLNSLKEHINHMGADLAHLQQMTDTEDAVSRQAITEVEPILRDMASQTENAIQSFNENHSQILFPAYTDRLKTIEHDSDRIAHLLHDAQKLNHIRNQETTITHELGM